MTILLPHSAPADERFWRETWPAFLGRPPLAPFSGEAVRFLDAFSKRILLDPALRAEPAFAALAHWARRGRVTEMMRGRTAGPDAGAARAARGVILHLAPANVDTLFAYSWFTSLLCGNLNIVRVSSRSLQVIAPLLGALREVLADPACAAVRDRTLLVGYEHDDALTGLLSDACHGRLIWGGDSAVRRIRAIPLPATAVEIAFADRFSLAAFAAAPLLALSDVSLERLAGEFCNDAFQFGQKACSSPRVVFFTGEPETCRRAAGRLWNNIADVVRRRGAVFGPADGVARLAAAMAVAAAMPGTRITLRPRDGAPPLVQHLPAWLPQVRELHEGAGQFIEHDLPSLADLAPLVTARDQTLVAFGYADPELRDFVSRLPARAIDRIVPPGRALDFDPSAWDGHNLLAALTREIALPGPSQ